jgi:hypothetical protein
LAAGAEEWAKKRPDNRVALAQRLNEFRQGCSVLILSEHQPLTPVDRRWLKDACQKWAQKLDGQLARLESGEPVSEVEKATDDMAKTIATKLRDRAAKPGTA